MKPTASFTLLALCRLLAWSSAASLRVQIPASNLIPNPFTLPSSTHATLTSGTEPPRRALLRRGDYFDFSNITTVGSHLLEVHSRDFVFAPYRIDIAPSADSAESVISGAWETYRGTKWEDRGVALVAAPTKDLALSVKTLSGKNFYEQRQGFNPMSLLKNPMILMAVVALAFTFGMPKLMENMDPEMRAEYDEMQKSSPMGSVTRAMQGGGGGSADGFDLAGFLAGSGKSTGSERPSESVRERKR
ncbi:uncharacterized protein A1O9_01441 [Exophiala aquamarina CBS 119918]|uniref:ER membrane protein complex subunit 7 beta-sandwich domain-containing protein n=1 Tax=Exophiala aquamarina CBS 119918 TaxID=1182545 RepID=A0A072PVT9_9EURO|nr:uncharacterized protein A1O9_01441 [Exophiala aquamarina CBS 119918]KEF63463.1 hypothetical protein A1O9_01441 [Exophiala aquamarina CBS 119918]